MHGFFITGTNTERGKTLVTTGLRLWLQEQGLDCLAMKAVQTGMEGHKLSPDLYKIYSVDYPEQEGQPTEAQVLKDLEPVLHLLQPYCYEAPCSPHLAAEREGCSPVNLEQVESCAQELQEIDGYCDFLLVEGAGGFYVPIDREKHLTMADIAQELSLPIILVAQSGLGAINDSCLSLMAMRHWGLPIVGFLLNDLEPLVGADQAATDYIQKDNPQIIAELSGVPYLGTLPYIADRGSRKELLWHFDQLCGIKILHRYLPGVKS